MREKKNTSWGEIHENLRVPTPPIPPHPRNKALLRDYYITNKAGFEGLISCGGEEIEGIPSISMINSVHRSFHHTETLKHQHFVLTWAAITKHFRYLTWRNPHLYKLYEYGLCTESPPHKQPNISPTNLTNCHVKTKC